MTTRPASTLLLLRSGAKPLEVLMVKRSASLFGAGWWVFPGGAVEDQDVSSENLALLNSVDDPADSKWLLAALRETAEEVGLCLTDRPVTHLDRSDVFESVRASGARFNAAAVGYLSRWIAPEVLPKRFDTRFFVAEWTSDQGADPDGSEIVSAEWVDPTDMLGRDHDRYRLVMPTIRHLQLLSRFESPPEAVEYAMGHDVVPIEPRSVMIDDVVHLVFLGEDGVEESHPMNLP